MANDTSGISVSDAAARQDAAGGVLLGPQAESVIGALGRVTEAARATPDAIRRAAQQANALRQAQAARGVAAARGTGVATGGGLAGASGTTALQNIREAAAQTVAAEATAQEAEVRAAQAGAEEAIEVADIQRQQQAFAGQFGTEIGTIIAEASQSGARPAAVGAEIAGKLAGLSIKDPVQRQAVLTGLGIWLGQRGYTYSNEWLNAVVDAGLAAEVASKAGLINPGVDNSGFGPSGIRGFHVPSAELLVESSTLTG